MKDFLKSIKILDIPIFLLMLFFTVFSFLYVYGRTSEVCNLVIEYQDKKWIYPLNVDSEIEIEGKIGITKIQVVNNEVKIVSSPCPNKTCISSPSLKKVGDWNACLPNRVFLYIREEH